MNREELIKKWLRDELSETELAAFKQLEDYDEIVKISDTAKSFKAPLYRVNDELDKVKQLVIDRPKKKSSVIRFIAYAAAAVVVFAVGFYALTVSKWDTTIKTQFAEKTDVVLPDNSEVVLNSASSLSFDKKSWNNERLLILHGEAYFKVAKGQKFEVDTDNGAVAVLGTQFNVKSRGDILEVTCFEGLVSVNTSKEQLKLAAGNKVRFVNGEKMSDITKKNKPDWSNNVSSFKSIPLQEVFDEFERQYDLKIEANQVDTQQIFTGEFGHDNKEIALKAITLPFDLTYTITNKTIRITASDKK